MYHALEGNRLYDFTTGVQVDVDLVKSGEPIDIIKFLEDTSLWMEEHHDVIRNKYLPFSCVAVGLPPKEASAFLFGVFVGRAMQKDNLTAIATESRIDKKVMAEKVKASIDSQIAWFKKLRKHIDKEKELDDKA